MCLIGRNYYQLKSAWTLEGLAQSLRVPWEVLEPIVESLEMRGLLARTGDDPPSYLPARPFETTQLKDVLDAVRSVPEGCHRPPIQEASTELAVEELVKHIDQAVARALQGQTLRDLALSNLGLVEVSQGHHKKT